MTCSPNEFWDVSDKGTELRKLRLMEPAVIGQTSYPFTGEGYNLVESLRFEEGHVWINDSQYFADVPPLSSHEDGRELPVKKTPFSLIYGVTEAQIEILRL